LPTCLVDVRIPGLGGPTLQAHLREAGSTLPIVFLSGDQDIPTIVQTIKAGAEDFLLKPVTSVTRSRPRVVAAYCGSKSAA
jgi:FixJ family two-component response regulator